MLELGFLYAIDPKFERVKGAWNLGLDLPGYAALLAKNAAEMPAAWYHASQAALTRSQ